MNKQPFTLDRTVRTIGGILLLIALFLFTKRLSSVLLPFVGAWLLAYMLNPFVHFIQNRLKIKRRGLAVSLLLISIIALISSIIIFAASSISNELSEMTVLIENYFALEHNATLPPMMREFFNEVFSETHVENLFKADNIIATIKSIVPKAFDVVSASFQYLTGLVVVFIFCLYLFFILMDFDNLSENWQQYIPKKYRHFINQLVNDLAEKMNTYFRKQALISFILGVLFAIGFSILDLPMAIFMGLFVGVLNMIPYMHSLGVIPPLCVALMQSALGETNLWWTMAFIGLIFVINQLILDLFLTPKIMGNATGLHPAIILLALSIWGSLMGVLGMIIALPITALIVSYYQHFVIEEKDFPTEDKPTQQS
ncbi:MAG: AI-2E family transporter [Paludibacteraceae bacterium]|nr:AI-2E family transporter [Paludibacteraceae bacterium]